MKRPRIITLFICIYCILNASDLIDTWVLLYKDPTGPIALALWVSPVIFFWYRQQTSPWQIDDRPLLLGIALFFSFNGMLGSLRVLGHAGLACAFAALIPPVPGFMLWLAASISWMPALDWFGGRFFPEYVTPARIVLASLPSWYLVRYIQRPEVIRS